jgi:HlyD family secretion protein
MGIRKPATYMRLLLSATIALIFVVAGCNRSSVGAPQSSASTPAGQAAVTIKVVRPERNTIRRTVNQPGSIQAYEQTPLFSKIAGYVQKLNADIGDRVSKGSVLAELWVPEMEVEFGQKQALVGQAEAEVKQAREAVTVAEADFKSAEAKVQATEASRLRADAQRQRAQSQYERLAKAGRGGVIGQEDVDETRLGYEAAKAGLEEVNAQVRSAQADRDASRAKWDKTKADLAVAEAHHDVAKKNRDLAKTLLDYRAIIAPFDGVVTQRQVDTGHFVQPATGPNGQALFIVMRTDVMRIRVQVPEAEADGVNDRTMASIRVPALQGYEVSRKITRTSWSLDRATRTLLAEVDVPDLQGKLRPGMYAYATISIEHPNVLTLPASAVVTEGDVNQGYRSFCYVVEDGKAWRTAVQIGVRDNRLVEVLKKPRAPAKSTGQEKWEEFTGEEKVVENISAGPTDGQPVHIAEAKP